MKTALILGCGFTGRTLAARLRQRGVTVYATTRNRSGFAPIEALGVTPLEWSAPEPLPRVADVAFALFPPQGLDPQVVAQRLAPVPRVVYLSSTAVYGDRQGGEVSEHTPTAPTGRAGARRLAAERALRKVGASVVRAGGIYGPGRNIIRRLQAGRLRVAGELRRPVNLIHVDDLATILLAVAERGERSEVVLATDGCPVPWIELARLGSELGGVPLPDPTPVPSSEDLSHFYTDSKIVRPGRLEELGVALRWPDSRAALRSLAIRDGDP